MNKNDILSKQDTICLLDLIHQCVLCDTEEKFRTLLDKTKRLINYDYALCALIDLNNKGLIKSYEILNINYPTEWLEVYVKQRYDQLDPIVTENITKYNLQFWKDTYKKYSPPKDFVYTSRDFGLQEGYTYGLKNFKGTQATLFSLSGKSIERHARTEVIIKHIIPHLHQALIRILTKKSQTNQFHFKVKNPIYLSPRESEVLKWLKEGKSSWEISVILNISERTINFHVNNIMRKLDVIKRTQAVAVGLEQGLIGLE